MLSHQVIWFIKIFTMFKSKSKNSNKENILLSPALVFQAGTIDLQLLDRKERKAEILKRVPDVSEGDAEGAAYCYLIP